MFEALERLLASRPLHEVQVIELIHESGISRASFYHYFASKNDVFAALLARLVDQVYDSTSPWIADSAHRPMLTSLRDSIELWVTHGPVVAAAVENVHADPQIGEAWDALVALFTGAIAKQIRRERRRGAAPGGVAAETMAALLVAGTERTLYAVMREFDPALDSVESALDAISAMWLATVYGDPARPAGSDGG